MRRGASRAEEIDGVAHGGIDGQRGINEEYAALRRARTLKASNWLAMSVPGMKFGTRLEPPFDQSPVRVEKNELTPGTDRKASRYLRLSAEQATTTPAEWRHGLQAQPTDGQARAPRSESSSGRPCRILSIFDAG